MKKLIDQIVKFGIVGVIAFLIDFGIYAVLIKLNVNYLLAQTVSFSISLAFNYYASVKWVFDAKGQQAKDKIIFVTLSVIGYFLNMLLLYIGVDKMHYNELLVKIIATGIVMVYNFISRKLLIEKKNS